MASPRPFDIYAMHSTGKSSEFWAVWKLITFIDQWCMNWIYETLCLVFTWTLLILWFIFLEINIKVTHMLENNKTILTLYLICAVASDSIWFRYQIIWVVLWGTCLLKSWPNFLGFYSFSNTAIINSMHVQKIEIWSTFLYYENVTINVKNV